MIPRLSTSITKNLTTLPPDILKLMIESACEAFAEKLPTDHEIVADGVLYWEEVLLSLGIKEKGALRQLNFQCSLNYQRDLKDDVLEKIYLALDALQSMMEDYLTREEDMEFPQKWTSFDFNGKEVWLMTSTENTNLEREADALLGEDIMSSDPTINEDFIDHLFDRLRKMRLQ